MMGLGMCIANVFVQMSYSCSISVNAGFMSRLRGGGGIKHELKKLMFSGDTPVPVCEENSVMFCMVMSVFHNYENPVSPHTIVECEKL